MKKRRTNIQEFTVFLLIFHLNFETQIVTIFIQRKQHFDNIRSKKVYGGLLFDWDSNCKQKFRNFNVIAKNLRKIRNNSILPKVLTTIFDLKQLEKVKILELSGDLHAT